MIFVFENEYDPSRIYSAKISKHNGSKVNQYLNGTYIATYNTMAESAKAIGANNHAGISSCCRGRQKTVKGFQFFYANDPNQPDKSKIIN